MDNIKLHCVQITENAQFDYENGLIFKKFPNCDDIVDENWRIESVYDKPLVIMPKTEYKKEVSDYIQLNKRLWYKTYIRAVYYDEKLDRELMLFILKDRQIGCIQYWNIVGICNAADWTEDNEEDGVIRAWYTTNINDSDTYDWVLAKQIRDEEEEKERLREEEEQKRYERMFD